MNNTIFFLLCLAFVLTVFSCQKEIITPKDNPPPCVGPEENFDTLTGFTIFEKGEQEFGYAKGIKINKPYEASVALKLINDTLFSFALVSYWPEEQGHSAVGEIISTGPIISNNSSTCFALTKSNKLSDSIKIGYSIVNDDVGILLYKLDESADNKLEIISFDKTTKKLKARLKASFIGEKEYLPDLPKHVRFIDTYIEHGY